MGTTSPSPATVCNVFVYGSLLADDVVRVLLNRIPPSSPATLNSFQRFSIKGRVYPAILPVENKHVTGKKCLASLFCCSANSLVLAAIWMNLIRMIICHTICDGQYVLFGITPPELYILDVFEDAEYERKTVDVYLKQDSSEKVQAETYIWSNKSDPNLYGEWDFEEWQQLHKEEFIKMCIGFMEELELPESKPRVVTYEEFFLQQDENSTAHT